MDIGDDWGSRGCICTIDHRTRWFNTCDKDTIGPSNGNKEASKSHSNYPFDI